MPRSSASNDSRIASKRPATPILQVSGVPDGDLYLAKVQRLINAQWTPPQVGGMGGHIQAVVKFRLDKNGQVSGIVVERTSGNEYYDLSAVRAIRTAILPTFPIDLSRPYVDAHFRFSIGESSD